MYYDQANVLPDGGHSCRYHDESTPSATEGIDASANKMFRLNNLIKWEDIRAT